MNGTHDAFISLMICLLCSDQICVLLFFYWCQPIVSNISTKNFPVSICIVLSEYWQQSPIKTRNIRDFTVHNPNHRTLGRLTDIMQFLATRGNSGMFCQDIRAACHQAKIERKISRHIIPYPNSQNSNSHRNSNFKQLGWLGWWVQSSFGLVKWNSVPILS